MSTEARRVREAAVMYVTVVNKGPGKETLAKVVAGDVAEFTGASSQSRVTDEPALPTRDGKQALVKGFYDAANQNEEIVPYIDERKAVVLITLSSRNKQQFDRSLAPFRGLVASYFFLTEKTVSRAGGRRTAGVLLKGRRDRGLCSTWNITTRTSYARWR